MMMLRMRMSFERGEVNYNFRLSLVVLLGM